MAFSVSYLYSIQDRYSHKLTKINRVTDKFTRKAKEASLKVKGLGKQMAGLRGIASTAAVAMATIFPIKQAIDFEFAMADVLKVINDITPEQIKALEKEIFATSIAMGRLPKDIAAVVEEGGKLGIPVEKLKEFTNMASRMAVAFDVTEEVAGKSLGAIKTRLKLNIQETGNLTDAMNFMADNTAASAAGLVEIIGRVSGTMKTIEMPTEFIAGWAALADMVEVTPRLAASGINQMMGRLKVMPGMMKKILADPSKTISDYLKKLAKIDKTRLPMILKKKFGDEAGRFVEKLVTKIELMDKTLGLVTDKTKLHGSMQRELNKKLSTTKVKIDRVKAAFNVLMITMGTVMLPLIKAITPVLTKIGEKLAAFAKAHPIIVKFALLFGMALAVIGAIGIAIGVVVGLIGALKAAIVVGLVAAVSAATTLIVEYWDSITAGIDSAIEKVMRFASAVSWAWKDLKEFLGFGGPEVTVGGGPGVAAANATAMRGTLNGKIDITTKGAVKAKAAFTTDIPGKLGVNMAPVGAG
jgi:TP901 family phage tail tape measure protein